MICDCTVIAFGTMMFPPEEQRRSFFKKAREHVDYFHSRGISAGEAFCPENKTFTDICSRHLKKIAEIINPDLLMFDDEMCLSVRPVLGCFCDKHMELYREKFGEDLTREELVSKIFRGKNDRYRHGWLEVVGNSMRKFCRMMKEAVDEVNSLVKYFNILFC